MKTLSPKQKELLKEFLRWKCEDCHKKKLKEELQIHRIHRGQEYSLRNIKIICTDCHNNFHYKEFAR